MPSIKLAITDDQVLFLRGLKHIIQSFENMEIIIEAYNGQQLLNAIEKEIPDVILLDLKMPVIDGLEATKIIKKAYPQIKIILLSMYDDERLISHLMKCGANGYLLKNEEPSILKKAIESVMTKDYYFSDYVSKALLTSSLPIKGKLESHLELTTRLGLTRRELEVLELICQQLTNPEIAKELFISKRTVEGHRKNLLEKTNTRNTAGLVIFAIQNRLINLSSIKKLE